MHVSSDTELVNVVNYRVARKKLDKISKAAMTYQINMMLRVTNCRESKSFMKS